MAEESKEKALSVFDYILAYAWAILIIIAVAVALWRLGAF